jgi:hypothetical protein
VILIPPDAVEVFVWVAPPNYPAEACAASGIYCRTPAGLRFVSAYPVKTAEQKADSQPGEHGNIRTLEVKRWA